MSYLGKPINFLEPYNFTSTGDGTTVNFTLAWLGGSAYSLLVFLDGVLQTPGVDFTLNGYTLTFTTAPLTGMAIVVYGLAMSGVINSVASNSITSDKLESLNLKALAGLTLSANKLLYTTSGNALGLAPFTTYAQTFLQTPDVATLRANIGTVTLSTDETIAGVKTFSSRPIVPRKPITFLSESGFNSVFMIYDGKLYSTSAGNATYASYTTGRGTNGTNPFLGVENFKRVPIPSTSPVVKAAPIGQAGAYALLQDGSLYTWGGNATGVCGVGSTAVVPTPTLSATGVVEVYNLPSSSNYNADNVKLAIKKSDNYIYICGYNGNNNLGVGDAVNKTSWTQITSLGTNVVKLFNLGSQNGCWFAQKSDDSIWAAGYNGYGQLGTADTVNKPNPVNVTTNWQGGADWVIEYMGGGFGWYDTAANAPSNTVMLLRNRTTLATKVLTCGYGVIAGDGTTNNRSTPYLIPNSGSVSDLSYNGSGHAVVHMLNNDGTLYAWGRNAEGQLGNGTTVPATSPTLVQSDVAAIMNKDMNTHSYGYRTSTWIKKTDGYVYCCGYNSHHELGLGHNSVVSSFTKTFLPLGVVEVKSFTSTSEATLIARTTDHVMYAWGYNGHNNLSTNTTINGSVPATVSLPE